MLTSRRFCLARALARSFAEASALRTVISKSPSLDDENVSVRADSKPLLVASKSAAYCFCLSCQSCICRQAAPAPELACTNIDIALQLGRQSLRGGYESGGGVWIARTL